MSITKLKCNLFFKMAFFTTLLLSVLLSSQVDASQTEYENRMRLTIDKMYHELTLKIDGLDPVASDFSNELQTLENYARKYVELFQTKIPVKNRLHELRAYHSNKRKKRWDTVNTVIKDIDFMHARYEALAIKLQSKRDKLIILSGGKLIFDYVLLPLDRWNALAERIVYYTDQFGPVKFVPEGGLGTTTASRRLGDISQEMLDAHNLLKEILYKTPKDSNDLFRLIRQAEVLAKKCRDLSNKIQYSLRIDRNNSLAIAEKRIKQYLDEIIQETNRILAITTSVSQCIIEPGEVTLDRSKPQLTIRMFNLNRSGLKLAAGLDAFSYRTDDPEVATVNQQGILTGKKSGRTELSAVNKKSGRRCSITVIVDFPPIPGKKVKVPDLIGLNFKSAEQKIINAGLTITVNLAAKMDVLRLPETVISQSPKEFSLVDSGSSVFITMNPALLHPAELVAIALEGDPPPPYLINKQFSLAAVVTKINPKNSYTFTWYINDKKIGQGQAIKHTFSEAGPQIIKVVMKSNDPREDGTIKRRIKIEYPRDFVVDFSFSPKLKQGETYKVGDQVTFTETCTNVYNITEYRWYINGNYIENGSRASYGFNEKGSYDVTLGIRKGSNFEELEHTKSITIGEKGIGVLGRERNRFKAKGGLGNLSVCSEYWVGGIGDWSSKCATVSNIGPVDGYALCTGDQSDGYNTGFFVYSKKGSDKLSFEVYHFNFNKWRGYIHYSGNIPNALNPDPESISISCRANVADVSWTNEDGSVCRTKIWKFRYLNYGRNYGVKTPVCSEPSINQKKLKRCKTFAKRAVEQFEENLSRKCNLQGFEWHEDEEGHKQWCLNVSKKEADDLIKHRDKALNSCGKSWCDAYARRAVEQNEENIRKGCGFGSRRWQSNYNNHYNWCLNVSKGAADSETRQRDKDLRHCTSGRKGYCKSYAEKAVQQNYRNIEKGCGYCGQRWQSSFDNHFVWCLEHPQSAGDNEIKAREELLAKCQGVSSAGNRTFYEPCYNGYRLDNCLNFGTKCEKPAADKFCEEKGFTEATRWELEKVRPTYIIGDSSICDADYCAGFKYITCSDYKYPDNKNPICTIKRPVSGVTIQAGKYLGFSAEASDPDKDKLTYSWIFEGGKPDHYESWRSSLHAVQWRTPGTFTVTLTVTDGKGGTCTDTVVIIVLTKDGTIDCNQYADKSVMQNEENLNKKCGFTGELWHSNKSGHTHWCLNAAPGSPAKNIEIREKALNECQEPSATTVTTDLVCDISTPAEIAFADAGNSINFAGSALSSTGGPLSFNWEFGEYGAEPSTSSQQNPAPVKFNWGGNYKVTLTVTDSAGNRCQSSRHILVYDRNDPREFCEGYAAISIEQNEENKRNNCGYSGGHWHSNEYDHQKWCQSVTLDQARAGLRDRDDKLKRCNGKTTVTQAPTPAPDKKYPDNKPNITSSGFDIPTGTDTGFTTGNQISHTPPPQSVGKCKFSCADKDNQEKGCCCFLGAHTYRFSARYVTSVLVQFDTGKRFNCRSAVSLEIYRGNGWETIKTVQANSSRNGSEIAPIKVLVPVNGTIEGFRISDGCVCCIDSSEITLNPDSSGGCTDKPAITQPPAPIIPGGRLTTTSSGFDTPTGTVTGSTSPPPTWNQPKYSDNTTGIPCGPDRAFIYSMFQSILDREPGKMELDEQIRDLRQGLLSRKEIVIRFFKSREYSNNNKSGSESYKDAYQAVLGRNPSPDEMRTFPRTYPYLMAMALFNTREYRNLCFPDVGGIKIISATYGGNCGAGLGNATSHIAQHCNGKTRCWYTVDHKIIGDPVPGCAKTYVVRYRCGNNPRVFEASLSAEAGWGDKAVFLNCEENPEPRPRDYDRDEPASRWPNRDNSFDRYDRPGPVDSRDSDDIHHHYHGSGSNWKQDPVRRPDQDHHLDRDDHPGINDSDDNIYHDPGSGMDDEPVERPGRNDLFDRNDSDDHSRMNDSDDTGIIGEQPPGGEPGQSDDLDQNRPSLPQVQGVR